MRCILFWLALFATNAFAGYDIHVTRKPFWADETGAVITTAEWLAYVGSDPEIVQDAANTTDDFIVSISGESFPLWYNPQLGEVFTKNPSDNAINKLKEIARSLRAEVQGDDGERYP